MSDTIESQLPRSASTSSLISHSTILILSGFLIGMAAGKTVRPDVENLVLLTGICGLLAYVGLEYVARTRQQRAAQLALERATTDLERRFERQLTLTGMNADSSTRRVRAKVVEQYLTVSCHSRRKSDEPRGAGYFDAPDC